jgi:hypothetical protein
LVLYILLLSLDVKFCASSGIPAWGILVFAGAALSHATMRDRVEVIGAKIKIKKPDSAMGTLAQREMTTCNPKSESEREKERLSGARE